jgi:hypothetical protein
VRLRYPYVFGALAAASAMACGSGGTVSLTGDASVDANDAHHDARPDAHDTASDAQGSTCNAAELGRGCISGPCAVTGPASALPEGATVTVTERPVPSALVGDALGSSLCALTVSGTKSATGLTLSIAEAAPPSSAALFEYVSAGLSQLVVTSQPGAKSVEGLVAAPGVYGATDRSPGWSPLGAAGVDSSSSGSQAALLRNLSSLEMFGAFYDGTHLFVCNGPRMLIYNSLPKDPSVLPNAVLGQADVDTFSNQASSSLFGATGCTGLWSDGTRLVAGQGSRVLVWDAIPTTSFTPADIELGQPDFSTNLGDNGGVSAGSLLAVEDVDSDGTQLVVADRFNSRVLIWKTFPTAIGQAADFEIGQPTFGTYGVDVGAVPIFQAQGALLTPTGVLVDGLFGPGVVHVPMVTVSNPASDETLLEYSATALAASTIALGGRLTHDQSGGFLVRDDQRVVSATLPATGAASINFVLGQPDSTRLITCPISASVVATMPAPLGYVEESMGGGKLTLIPDLYRLLIFDTPPAYNFAPASRVLGQAGFTTNGQVDYRGTSASTLAGPADVAASGTTLAVADRGNNRVLLYSTSSLANENAPATAVVGQPDAVSYVPNLDQRTPSAARLSGPGGVALDGTHLIVADSENHRVLIWNAVPTTNGVPADVVLGQTDFTSHAPNHGNLDANGDQVCDADSSGLFYPTGVASDGTHLFVADRLNNRVLVWSTFPASNGKPADAVLGQADFTSSGANASNGGFTVVANGLNLPTGLTLSGTSLYIADSENNRVVRWDTVTTAPVAAAFIGQANGTSVSNPNTQPMGGVAPGMPSNPSPGALASSLVHPRGVTVAGGVVYVSEIDTNRVHLFDATSLAPQGELGQTSDTLGTVNTNGVGAGSLDAPWGLASDAGHLWVADSANHRVLGYPSTPALATGALATIVIGQSSFQTAGFNQTSTAAGGATSQPRGLSLTGKRLFVADTNNHRVTVFATPLQAGQAPTLVLGQPNDTLALPNAGGVASASTLDAPQGVHADSARVLVADTGNNRVLVYDAASTTGVATLVLGQTDFTSTAAPATSTASSMNRPTGVFTDGTSLWVADTANHRVLVWNNFPTANGQPADLVLGQSSFAEALPNQGGSAASAETLAFPGDIVVANGIVYVADSGNNRVVFFKAKPTAVDAPADGVLGQADLTSRIAAVTPGDLAHLAGPVKLAVDDENLYVADRDLGRAVVYELGAVKSGASATQTIGVQGGLTIQSPGGVAAAKTAFFTSTLYVADTAGSRVDIVGTVSRLAGD